MICNPYGAPISGPVPVGPNEVVIRVRSTLGEGVPNTRYVCPGCIDELGIALCAR
jgi:hypothetical protein